MPDDRLSVLFLCTGNSARSQMAEAILRHLSHGAIDVASAGTEPKSEIHPMARRAVSNLLGLELTGQYPKSLTSSSTVTSITSSPCVIAPPRRVPRFPVTLSGFIGVLKTQRR
jgi:hypothetical protein